MTSQFQAIILAGGGGSHLGALTAGQLPKVLLPVANRPLITFPLRTLEEAGITDILIVCEGDVAASAVRAWLTHHHHHPYTTTGSIGGAKSIEVLRMAEGVPSVTALRQVMDRVKSENCVVLSGDVVTEIPLRAQLLQHQLRGAMVTALFGRRKTSAAADTQPGKPPRNVDYVGLADDDQLVFFHHSPDAVKEVALPFNAFKTHPSLHVTTNLVDMQVYVFCTAALKQLLASQPHLLKLEDHLLPFLAKQSRIKTAAATTTTKTQNLSSNTSGGQTDTNDPQMTTTTAGAATAPRIPPPPTPPPSSSSAGALNAKNPSSGSLMTSNHSEMLVGHMELGHTHSALSLATLSHDGSTSLTGNTGANTTNNNNNNGQPLLCTAYIAPEGSYCQRANRPEGYAEVNREAVSPELAPRLLREQPSSRGENFLGQGVVLGTKATVGSGCMLGPESVVGDKTSVKRSVVGRQCVVGANVKILNSVLMDGVQVGDNCHIQNSIVSGGCVLQSRVTLKDCQVGPGVVVAGGSDHKGEILKSTGGGSGSGGGSGEGGGEGSGNLGTAN